MLNRQFEGFVQKVTGAYMLENEEIIQELWDGYGHIIKYTPEGSDLNSIILKHIGLPNKKKASKSWNSDVNMKRKLKSYKIEMEFYDKYSDKCNDNCYIPKCLGQKIIGDELLLVLEDLDDTGFPIRKNTGTWEDVMSCLKWLANFHAVFLGETPEELWKIGTYWYLGNRNDELQALKDNKLKKYAGKIDQKLNNVKFKTFVHGDAKIANFCFSKDSSKVAGVDFQYVGGGCGMKDVAYFIGSCLYEKEYVEYEEDILTYYFEELKTGFENIGKEVNFKELENEWREMYHIAWTDFHRFYKGWTNMNWKKDSYSEIIAKDVINKL